MILELFAGAGGASVGIHRAIPDETVVGFEWDAAACRTRAAAGLLTIRADVSQTATAPMVGKVSGVWSSPPCPTFSSAGSGAGVSLIPALAEGIRLMLIGDDRRAETLAAATADLRTEYGDKAEAHAAMSVLVLEPARFAYDLRPTWVACEQVPQVLPLWEAMAWGLRKLGYATWTGVLDTADYGVPQNRNRAILMARQGVRQMTPPEPTHCDQRHSPSLFLLPWVSMADALGWGMDERPYLTVATGHLDAQGLGGEAARSAVEREREDGGLSVSTRGDSGREQDSFSARRPSRTITGKSDSRRRHGTR